MFSNSHYTIGWVCALETELVAATVHLDEEHEFDDYEAAPKDDNTYVFGRIGKHNIVIATLPTGEYGIGSAASVARDMIRSFTDLRMCLMVGIGGGAPLIDPNKKPKRDIRLGDVVVSVPGNAREGVLQYDYGKTIQGQDFKLTLHLNSPPKSILAAIDVLGRKFQIEGNDIDEDVRTCLEKNKKLKKSYQRPDQTTDRLYRSSYIHTNDDENCLKSCNDPNQIIERDPRGKDEDSVIIHKGLIASANQLMKDALKRDELASKSGVLCFEMEAAGLMNQLPCLVVRGICDYSDTHKNKEWQGYAAMTAAAYAKKLLLRLHPVKVAAETRLSDLKEIKEQLQEFGSSLDVIRTGLLEHTKRSLGADIEKWLSAPDPETNYISAKNQQEPGTGHWLMESKSYLQWKVSDIKHLWLHGKAGCGKSVISASIIENVREHCTSNASMGCAIFYFTFSDSRKQTYIDCLRSVVYQLSKHQSVSSSLEQLYKAHKNGQEGGSRVEESLQNILLHGIRSYKKFFLVLDALDESPEIDSNNIKQREKLLEWLKNLSTKLPVLQILATSRRLQDIEAELTEMKFHMESMITGCINLDISKYVINQLNKDRKLRGLDTGMKEKIQDTFTMKADGMFRWATCQMNDLKRLPSTRPSDLEKALKDLPASLDETYNRMINNIPIMVHNDALVLLRWLTYSHRPLTLQELSEARIISLGPGDGNVAFHDRGRADDILEILSGLVLITEAKNESIAGQKRKIDDSAEITLANDTTSPRSVRLAHFSVQEYLESSRASIDRPQLFRFQAQKEHQFLSQCCMLYLTHYASASSATKTSRDLEYFPLLEYAASSWYGHYQNTDDVNKEVQFVQSEAFMDSLLIHNPDCSHSIPFVRAHNSRENRASCLYYAALLGLSNVVRALIEDGANINAKGGYHVDALQVAVARGHDSVFKILVEAGTVSNTLSISYSGSGAKGNLTVTFQR